MRDARVLRRWLWLFFCVGGVAACEGGDRDAGYGSDAPGDGDDAGTDAGHEPGTCREVWEMRSGVDVLTAGVQDYRCYTDHVPAGMNGHAIRLTPVVPPEVGVVHHMVLVRGESEGPFGCEAAPLFNEIVFGGGNGTTGAFEMPAGVGLPVSEGEGFVLQVHLSNATDFSETFDVGVDFCLVDPDEIEQDAAVVSYGPVELSIPDDGAEHVFYDDTCVVEGERTVFGGFPHMHQLGTRIELGVDGKPWGGVSNWTFSDQPFVYADPPFVVRDGQRLTVSCTYVNPPGNGVVEWGNLSEDEMCFGFVYYYPAGMARWCPRVPFL